MNNLMVASELTMSSEQISELLEIRHDNVRQSAINLQSHGIIAFTEISVKGVGRPKQVMSFNERDSIVLAAKLNDKFMARVVDGFLAMRSESAPVHQIPQTYAKALLLAGELAEKVELQNEQLAIAAPKVEFVDRFVESTGNKSFREVAKMLKANEREFRAFLYESKVMYQLGGGWTAHANHIDAGRFYCTAGESNGHAYTTCKFTPKGIEYIAGKWIAHKELTNSKGK